MKWALKPGSFLLGAVLLCCAADAERLWANDDFTNAFSLEGTNLTVSADNTLATAEAGEPPVTPTAVGKSLWWTWTAPADGELELATATEGPWWVETAVYTGDTLTELTPLGVSSNKLRSPLFLGVRQGVLYHIAADSVDNTYGSFTMSLNFWATPSNDWFTNRAVLSPDATAFDIALGDASREAREPSLKGGYNPQASGRTLWWTFTPPSAGTLRFAVSTVDAHTYVSIGVFRGTRLGGLSPVLTGTSSIDVKLQVGVPYQILVDPWLAVDYWGGHLETLHVESQFYPVPANDKVAQATALTGPSVALTDNNLGARLQGGEPRAARMKTLGAALWYTWTAPDAGWAYVTASSQYFEPVISVYQGARPGALHRVAQTVKPPPSVTWPPVGFATAPGMPYQIEVDGLKEEGAQPGPFELDLEFTTLRLTSPTDGLVCEQSSLPLLAVNVPNPAVDGQLSSVNYVLYNVSLGPVFGTNLTTPPFTAVPADLPPGRYAAIALATNDVGRMLLTAPVTFTVRPPGDDFATAMAMSGAQWQFEGTVDGASLQRGEPAHRGKGVDGSVWFSWTAPTSGTVELTTSFSEALHVEAFSGTKLAQLKRIALTTANGWVYTFSAVAGTTYDFAVCRQPMPAGSDGESFSVALAVSAAQEARSH